MGMLKSKYILFFLLTVGLFASCRKEEKLTRSTSAKLEFSVDTVIFDTVFTTIGSATKQLKVYNRNNQKIEVSSISLVGNSKSTFRMNVDGVPGNAKLIQIPAHDSIYIFIDVTVDPNNQNSPLIVTDAITFVTNGNMQQVDLVACGQDAHFIVADTYSKSLPPYKIVAYKNDVITWGNDKPYVIYGYAVIDSAGVLEIEKGCRVYFHKNSGLWCYRYGQLKVTGTLQEPVTFQGDRLEPEYRDIPGQWDRIWINESDKESCINYAIIKNGFIGIQAEVLQEIKTETRLHINNTVIKNMSGLGIFTRVFNITSTNTLVSNCAQQTLAITMGGNYSFRHCTFSNYWSYDQQRQTPSLLLNNYNSAQDIPLDSAYFGNCIIYGDQTNEITLDKKEGSVFNFKFDHCLLKIDPTANTDDLNYYTSIIKNQDPLFSNPKNSDVHLRSGSPAIDAGLLSITKLCCPYNPLNADIEGNVFVSTPDMGAYESN